MPQALRIRPAQPQDLDAVEALARACFGASAWSRAQWAAIPPQRLLVALAPTQTCAGYVAMQWLADEAEVESLAVREEFRRQGVGQALLAAGLEAAHTAGVRYVFLEVRESNAAARAFYQRSGFHLAGRRPGYYHRPPEAALLLRALI
ncbi:MAG TPA: ribosomal protein S18-alanine N-acetyltransferase [Terriglobales bacterium]|nr:ribosomal protein S18-alanine N-acetyltransferase [Terriglobales bacterium]HVA64587.1 ribosomal protein S18-alanine N-acetyltransferase [Terriglobales bacterium]